MSGISATACETAASERDDDDDDDDDDDRRRRALDFHALATAATLRDGVRYQHVPFDDLRVMKRLLEAEEKDVRAMRLYAAARTSFSSASSKRFMTRRSSKGTCWYLSLIHI